LAGLARRLQGYGRYGVVDRLDREPIREVPFNVCIGNTDAHAKNLSVLVALLNSSARPPAGP
jgi:hypothetical protein